MQGHCAAALRKMNLIASLFILGHVIIVKGHYDYYYDYDYGDYDYYDYDIYDYYNDYFTCDQTDQDFCTWKTLWTDVQKPTAIAGTNLVKIDYDYFDILIDGAIAECAPSLGIKGNILYGQSSAKPLVIMSSCTSSCHHSFVFNVATDI